MKAAAVVATLLDSYEVVEAKGVAVVVVVMVAFDVPSLLPSDSGVMTCSVISVVDMAVVCTTVVMILVDVAELSLLSLDFTGEIVGSLVIVEVTVELAAAELSSLL